ncbi:hypothetical protein SAMN05216466_118168 [Paraburkholderia phenazinium]|uniref:Uncharacterized protein n=1 Tax=Paraburkholderia phenazinium TaxID=60549 RepID=A0A1G8IMS5_9BURK|nr:hypothetical protein SAMN05216466_118168 [Paraburkholderia phenazinium]
MKTMLTRGYFLVKWLSRPVLSAALYRAFGSVDRLGD